MQPKVKNIIAYVASLPKGAAESIRKYEKKERTKFRVMLIWDRKIDPKKTAADFPEADIFLPIDFKHAESIAEALLPYQEELIAITCRTESYLSRFIKIIPHVPYLRTPSTQSLEWSTDKLMMRRRFALLAKEYSPKYAVVKENSKMERDRVIAKIGFPMIMKPTNLAQSLLVTICYHEEELKEALTSGFKKISKIYSNNGRSETPQLMVEQYMEGDMFSVDAYVNDDGGIQFCPMVKVVTGKQIGHDDFYNYLHMSPTGLKSTSIENAHKAAEAGIHALGLRNTTVHVELMKIEDDWKLIEIGARIGGFRVALHSLSCGIDHSLNDVLVRMGKKTIVPKKCNGYAASLKWYPKKEGTLVKMKGIKKIQEVASFKEISINSKVGDKSTFAKNGGKAVFSVTLCNESRSELLADIRRIEKGIDIQTQ